MARRKGFATRNFAALGCLILLCWAGADVPGRLLQLVTRVVSGAFRRALRVERLRRGIAAAREKELLPAVLDDGTLMAVPAVGETALVQYDPAVAAQGVVAQRDRYVREVAALVHLKFGRRPNSVAQWDAAKVVAAAAMREHGHRFRHIERDLPRVMLYLASPTHDEEDFQDWLKTAAAENPSRHGWAMLRVLPTRNLA
jgi:hypothetical protein